MGAGASWLRRGLGSEQPAASDDAEVAPSLCYQAPALPEALTALTWNIAAVNNNPFEYWITYDDPVYLDLMQAIEEFLENPAENDAEVRAVFTEAMFQELKGLCEKEGMAGLEEVEAKAWRDGGGLHLSSRRIVAEFMKDPELGAKRLISMPDRVTNTINVVGRADAAHGLEPACRPSVINNYTGDLSRMEAWWAQWKHFMFVERHTVRTSKGILVQKPVEMLEPIPRAKYPAVTEDEERLAVPLQILCQAIFDAVLVHFMNMLSPNGAWQVVKARICEKLCTRKREISLQILSERYAEVQVICLQEVAANFKDGFVSTPLAQTHELVHPVKIDGKRDQNSLLVLRKDAFVPSSIREVTHSIAEHLKAGVHLADGDLLAVEAIGSRDGKPYLLVSFHGDTNGLLTVPLVTAVHEACQVHFKDHFVVLGLDANVYEQEQKGRKCFTEFLRDVRALGFTTCWGDDPDVSKCRTTCNARTYLQPQLNKAVRLKDRVEKSDKNPKDIILFYRHQMEVLTPEQMGEGRQPNPVKDNTGHLRYVEDSVFPTLSFPSDHGILAAALRVVPDRPRL